MPCPAALVSPRRPARELHRRPRLPARRG
jgi:hypothetical protein